MSPAPRAGLAQQMSQIWRAVRAWRWFALNAALWITTAAALIVGEFMTQNWMVFVAGPALFFFFAFVYWLAGRGSQ